PAEAPQMADDRQRLRKDHGGERIVQEVFRHAQQVRIVIEPGAKRLQAAQIIGKSQSLAQGGEYLPVALPAASAERLLQTIAQIRAEAIVVQQGVVDIQQKNDLTGQHGGDASFIGLRQVSAPRMTLCAAAGPQLPGSYCTTGSGSCNTGSTTRHAASTQSSCVNSDVSPRTASPSKRSYGDFSLCE